MQRRPCISARNAREVARRANRAAPGEPERALFDKYRSNCSTYAQHGKLYRDYFYKAWSTMSLSA